MLRGIMAVSADGYVCKGPNDDMRWTGSADKRLFREQTMDQTVGFGSRTFDLMPKLKGRRMVRISSAAEGRLPFPENDEMTLGDFYLNCPDGHLAGGQTVLISAIKEGFCDRVVLSHVRAELGGGEKDQITSLCHSLGWHGRVFPQDELQIVTWNRGS